MEKVGSAGGRGAGPASALVLVWMVVATAGAGCAPPPEASPAGRPEAGGQPAAGLGEGFLVWESNRGGSWRIWIRDLDLAGEPRRLTPDEKGRDHCCPHISPDGSAVAYLSLPGGQRTYPEEGAEGALRLIAPDGGGDRQLAPAARTYFENRAAVWSGSDRLIYIRGDRRTVLRDLADGSERVLLSDPPGGSGWLVNASLSHATPGAPFFAPFDAAEGRVAVRTPLGGCQPYFSHDGRWGYWVAGAGGPIHRLDLASGHASALLAKNDRRVPDGLGYAYFPMLSADGRLFAFAASTGDHDHFKADYEILVAESDPRTLELIGDPVRMTRHPATDRFPDVFLAPLALGRHYGEAPLTVDLAAGAEGGGWSFDFGDGSPATGESRHTYEMPGRFAVRARRGGELRRGQTVVRPAAPPRPLGVEVRGERRLVVSFDEEIAAPEPRLELESGIGILSSTPGRDGRSLVIELARPLESWDRLRLAGITDRAQEPNELAPVELEVEPPLWPSDRDGLVYLWENGEAPNLIWDVALEADRACTVTAAGRAHFDRDFAMVLNGGWYVAVPNDANYVRHLCQATHELAIEAVLTPAADQAPGLRRIIELGGPPQGRNFLLGQSGDRLVFSGRIGGAQAHPPLEVATLAPGRASHVVVSYRPGRLAAFVDGEPVLDSDALQGDFFHWRTVPLTFGAGPGGVDGWAGRLEGIALFNRFVEAPEARENFARQRRQRQRRPEVPRLVVEATLKRGSPAPTLEEISPYREALAAFEYRVERVLEGEYGETLLRVAHWSILDGEEQPVHRRAPGERRRLVLEPFADNRQLESVYLADALEPAPLPLFHAVAE